jgi:hypothetical protein
MSTVKFEEGIKIIPTNIQKFPIHITKEGVEKLGVRVIFKAPKKESIKTIREGEAINSIKGGYFRGINKEITWNQGEKGTKTVYVDILRKDLDKPYSFEIEIDLVSNGIVELKYCKCVLVPNLTEFLNKNIQKSEHEEESIDLFDAIENKRIIPVLLDSEMNELVDLGLDIKVIENELKTTYINEELFHVDGELKGTIIFPPEETFELLEKEEGFLALKLPFENIYKIERNINIYSKQRMYGYINPMKNLIILTNEKGELIKHKKGDQKEKEIEMSLNSMLKLKTA